MILIKTTLSLLMISSFGICMQTPKELALHLEDHPVAITSFLWRYAIAEFCDIDEKGVYYNGIHEADHDVSFTLPWEQVKKALGKAYEDLAQFDVWKEDVPLKKEYRASLREMERNVDPAVYEKSAHLKYLAENRKKYHAAWVSGDPAQVKEALKLDIFTPHID
jgi:hypothetical protein